MKEKIAGIDYSLSSPAMTIFDGSKIIIHCAYQSKKRLPNSVHQQIFDEEDKSSSIKNDPTDIVYLVDYGQLKIYFHWLPKTFNSIYEKIYFLSSMFLPYLKSVYQIALEDYSFGSRGRVFGIAENTGFLKMEIWKQGGKIPFLFSPKTIKKFASGSGNASKERMIECFENKLNIDLYQLLELNREKGIKNPITDIVDSYFVCLYLQQFLQEEKSDDQIV